MIIPTNALTAQPDLMADDDNILNVASEAHANQKHIPKQPKDLCNKHKSCYYRP